MMAYDSQFVLCVLHKGSPVREINGKVSLPFHSEYKIRLKNKNPRLRAQTRIWVDGRKASNLGDIILQPGQTLDLERFLDSSLDSGNRFKFVPLSDGRVNDPTDPDNGIIKVEFYREVEWHFDWHPKPRPITKGPWSRSYRTPGIDDWNNGTGSTSSLIGSSGGSFSTSCQNINSTYTSFSNTVPCAAEGATVEGGYSGQSFSYGEDFVTETFPITLTLRLQGLGRGEWRDEFEVAPRSQKKKRMIKFCPHCGARRQRKADHFCQRCGTAYHPRYERERGTINPR